MNAADPSWIAVEGHLVAQLVPEDADLAAVRDAGTAAGLPAIEVSPLHGKLLYLICRMVGARRALEFGTLAGYSTQWLARGVGRDGHVTTLEIDPAHADVARASLERSGLSAQVDVLVGPALQTSERLADQDTEAYDVVFIDADKVGNRAYLEVSLRLTRPGSVIVVDNVVRGGSVVDPAADDASTAGTRAVLDALGHDPRLEATALQTVGAKGWDGFALARVR